MKTTLLNELIVSGATQRLNELNKEVEQLKSIINRYSAVKIPVFKKKKHWTQTPRGRKIMSKRAKAIWKAKKNVK